MSRSPYISPNSLFDRAPGYFDNEDSGDADEYLDSDNRFFAACESESEFDFLPDYDVPASTQKQLTNSYPTATYGVD